MGPIHLFDIASRQAQWLAVRQDVVARNVSNANTPGYTAMDVAPFDSVFQAEELTIATPNPRHMGTVSMETERMSVKESSTWDVVHSGNSVSLDQQLVKAADIHRGYSLNRSIVKAFNQMLLTSVKG